MSKFFAPPFWLPVICALLSAGMWIWSRHLPESVWESSRAKIPPSPQLAETAPAPTPAPTPAPSPEPVVEAPAPPAKPAPAPALPATATASPSATPPPTSPTPNPAPRPTDAELAGPLPQHAPEEVAPASSSPAPSVVPSAPLDLADIARQPQLWPRQVVLLTSVRFSVVLKGVNVGNVQIPAGRGVLLRKVNPDGTVEIELQESPGSQAKVKAQATDLLARARALAGAKEKAVPSP